MLAAGALEQDIPIAPSRRVEGGLFGMIAEAVEELISLGHPENCASLYTPRRMAAFLDYARARQNRKYIMDLHIAMLAARGDQKDIEAMIRTLSRNA